MPEWQTWFMVVLVALLVIILLDLVLGGGVIAKAIPLFDCLSKGTCISGLGGGFFGSS